MSAIITRLNTDLKDAMRAGDALRRDCVRGLITMAKNEAIARREPLDAMSDDTVVAVLKRARKQRDDAAAQYRDGGRPELADKESAEAALIAAYLPAQMDDAAVAVVVDEVMAAAGDGANFGAVMGQVMARTKGQADGAVVKRIVEAKMGK